MGVGSDRGLMTCHILRQLALITGVTHGTVACWSMDQVLGNSIVSLTLLEVARRSDTQIIQL